MDLQENILRIKEMMGILSESLLDTNSVIGLGALGIQVETLQNILGIFKDGKFGSQTKSCLQEFQKQMGENPDGIVGPKTKIKLKDLNDKKIQWKIPEFCKTNKPLINPKIDVKQITPIKKSLDPIIANGTVKGYNELTLLKGKYTDDQLLYMAKVWAPNYDYNYSKVGKGTTEMKLEDSRKNLHGFRDKLNDWRNKLMEKTKSRKTKGDIWTLYYKLNDRLENDYYARWEGI